MDDGQTLVVETKPRPSFQLNIWSGCLRFHYYKTPRLEAENSAQTTFKALSRFPNRFEIKLNKISASVFRQAEAPSCATLKFF